MGNNGGTIYVGVTENNNPISSEYDDKQKKVDSPIASVQNHIIYGIKLNSKQRYKLKTTIIDDILGGFTPQIVHLLNNFDLKFIPVVSQNGTIVPRHFVIKITVVAPILGLNGEQLQFTTSSGYAHVIDF